MNFDDEPGAQASSIYGVATRRQFMKAALAAGVSLPVVTGFLDAWGRGFTDTANAARTKAITMKLGTASGPTYYQAIAGLRFKQRVEKATSGSISVQLFLNDVLGSDPDQVKGLQLGTLESYIGATANMIPFEPTLGVLDLPYIFESPTHYYTVMNTRLGRGFKEGIGYHGIHVLEWWEGGYRDIYNNGHVVNTPTDLQGMKLRTLPTPAYVAYFKALGAVPVALAYPELYLALQQGTLNGAEGGLASALSVHQDQVFKYTTITHHSFTPAFFGVSASFWGALSKSNQKIIQDAAKAVTPYQQKADTAFVNRAVARFKAENIQVLTPNRAPFKAIAQQVWSQFSGKYGAGSIKEIRKAA
jgi:tripartite ATP-independent transporter DctP family solute receptor